MYNNKNTHTIQMQLSVCQIGPDAWSKVLQICSQILKYFCDNLFANTKMTSIVTPIYALKL